MTARNKVAIAIVTYNSAKKLPDCLSSLKKTNYPPELIDIIVVDNNSEDNSIAVVKEYFPSVRLIANKDNRGFASANNQAYEAAKSLGVDYLVLLNDDTIVDSLWLAKMIETAESDNHVAAVQAKLMLYPEKNLINSYGNALTFLDFGYCNDYRSPDKTGEAIEVAYPSGAAVAIKMSALESIGLFDESFFMYHEDVDLGWRLRLIGYKIMMEPNAVVYHKYSFGKASYKYYHMERNRQIVALKNYKLATLLIFFPPWLIMELGLIFFAAVNGWLKEKLQGYAWIIKNAGKIKAARQAIQKQRVVSDRKILKLFVSGIKFQDVDNPILKYLVNPFMFIYLSLAKIIIFW